MGEQVKGYSMRQFILISISAAIGLFFAGGSNLSHADEAVSPAVRDAYVKRCSWCHGLEGAGDGPASGYLNPAPRDFTLGMYKWKTTPYDEYSPSDGDLERMIAGRSEGGWDGLKDTSMPGWSDTITRQEIRDIGAYIKTFASLGPSVNKVIEPPSGMKGASKNVLEQGRKLFLDRCSECHGELGRGDGTKRLKDDWGGRTWPRNLTKDWTFRAGSDVKDIYRRIMAGIPGTQMPSFADPQSKKRLSDEEAWAVASYVKTLNAPHKRPVEGAVINAVKIDTPVPTSVDDERWEKAAYASFYTLPQVIAGERHFTPTINSMSVKALYNDMDIAFLVEWDDPTRGVPGDVKSMEIAGGEVFVDGAAMQFTVKPSGTLRPYFGMGDGMHPVNLWMWQSAEGAGAVRLLNARGVKEIDERDAPMVGLTASGVYSNGQWKAIFTRPLLTEDPSVDIQFSPDTFIPVALSAWDGSNNEKGSKHVLTQWQWVRLGRDEGGSPYLWPALAGVAVLAIELLWVRSARKRREG
ncbi:MAG: c-type cytochrome [Deltaproteobacteria bacterium]